jgi:hypothetical protein
MPAAVSAPGDYLNTQAPAVQETPIPASQLSAAAQEGETKLLTLRGNTFRLMPKLSLGALVAIGDAEQAGDIGGLVRGAAKLIVKDDRDRFLDFMLEEPDDPNDSIELEEFLEAMDRAAAGVTGRPPRNAGS